MKHFFFSECQNPYKSAFFFMLFIFLLFSNCAEDPQVWKLKSQEQVAGDYIANNTDQYSEFNKLIEATEMGSLLNIRGPYTIFLPTNDAMFAYYKQKKVNSLSDFSDVAQRTLILNHIVTNEINTSDFGLGALRDANGIGDFLVTEFHGSDIFIEKYSKIIKRDIRLANGYINVIDKVIDPIIKDIYTIISDNSSYKIFSEALSLSGLKDTLQLITIPYGEKVARTRFTVLAVPDTIFQRYGINNVGDLMKWCGAKTDSLTSLNNPFYRYMEYHCLDGSHFLSDLVTGIYPVLSHDNNISVTIDTDYKLNLDRKTNKYTSFIVQASNTPAKNGVLHAINDILPVTDPEPTVIIFETTDFFDLKQGDYYGKYYARWYDGENTFAKIHWTGDYLLYFIRKDIPPDELINFDCLEMTGWWSVSITFPKVMKGKYTVSIFQADWESVTDCRVYIDGILTNYTYHGVTTGGYPLLQKIADVNFTTTAEHTITLKNISAGRLAWDYVRFDPVE